jgi:hypothetical protein
MHFAIRAALYSMCCALFVSANAQPELGFPRSLPMSATLSFESVRLAASERLGLLGAGVAFEVGSDWWAGPVVYGAATGQHAGFFVGGGQLSRNWTLTPNLTVVTGVFVGGGGGGNAPVGGGLMLRPSISLVRRIDPWNIGVTLSNVHFASGDIHSSQLGLLLSWNGNYRYYDSEAAGHSVADAPVTGFGLSELSATFGQYRLRDASGRHPSLVGARAEWRDSTDNWHGGIEAAAAAGGNAAGYMELLGSLGWEHAVPGISSIKLGARAALGLGGGGAIAGDGGILGKVLATARWEVAPGWQLGLEAGATDGAHGQPRASTVQAWIATELKPETAGRLAEATPIARNEWVATVQHLAHMQRLAGGQGSVDTLGGSFNHFFAGPLYLSMQAHSAFAGGAGAFSMGLIGVGAATAPGTWRTGAELLAGAAGGGGVAARGGALAQATAWTEFKLGREGSIRLGLGELRSIRAGLSSPAVQISWAQAFGLPAR